eukprot:1159863-Pelagomonas_calceolata.AAC.4
MAHLHLHQITVTCPKRTCPKLTISGTSATPCKGRPPSPPSSSSSSISGSAASPCVQGIWYGQDYCQHDPLRSSGSS